MTMLGQNAINNCMHEDGYTTETVSVQQLFEEELEALQDQHERLIEEDTPESVQCARKIAHVIEYFKLRLGVLEETMEQIYGAPPDKTKH